MIPDEDPLSSSSRADGSDSLLPPTVDIFPLSLAEARSILFWSFFISQGNTVLHEEIFRYIAQHRQGWRFPQQQQNALYHQIEVIISRLIARREHAFVKKDVIESDLGYQIRLFAKLLNGPRRQAPNASEVNLRHIIRRLMKEDGRFLGCPASEYLDVERRDCRFREGDEVAPGDRPIHPLQDPFFSFVCFALLGQPLCRVRVMNDLMADVRRVFLERGHTWRKVMVGHEVLFSQIASVWNEKHPLQRIDSTVYLPFAL